MSGTKALDLANRIYISVYTEDASKRYMLSLFMK